jgi:D-beta-D-heptose 7-phosphate kinase/D-beta-D-heptose 1-phosphate adenosyltransferase
MHKDSFSSKIILDAQEISSHIDRKNKTVLFTNGCFDLLHAGHLHLLKECRKLADTIIVGLNDDASIKRLKGNNRPIDNLSIRIEKLSKLDEVDFIIPFSEDTPLHLIKKIRPDILLKGGDYKAEQIVGANEVIAYGGKIVVIPLLEGFSTTKIIESRK